jgi:hypothetical protein
MYISNSKARKVVYFDATHHRNSSQSAIFSSLEDTILPENPVRFIDAFVEALSLQTLGFSVQTIKGVRALILKSFLKSICMGI